MLEYADQNRIGYDIIIDEIPEKSRVLDLGCGDGVLLQKLRQLKSVDGYGVEISADGVSKCLENGLYCYQGDIDDGLSEYKDNSFDYVVLNQTLQDTKRPEYVLAEILRICRSAIVSFPNFGYIRIRMQHLLTGRMPRNRVLPYNWYDSPNIHLLSIKDFQWFCESRGYPIRKEIHFRGGRNGKSSPVKFFPNIMAEFGLFILDGDSFSRRKNPDGK
jgi:methionine biosynthesis protein MetW